MSRLLLLALCPVAVLAAVQEIWWNVTYVYDASPDALYPRRVIGVNNTWPPPPMDVSTDDLLVVHATNSLEEEVTLHHHGMYFNASSWMDGAMGVSQCGIPPGDSFDYVVPVNSSAQWGTYWVHAHSNGQYVDGLRAPLVLHPQQEAYPYDAEFTVVLADWYHDEHAVLLAQYMSVADPGGAEPIPSSALIYFAQNGSYLPPKPDTDPPAVTAATGFNQNATLSFQPGKTYRLRIINTSAFAAFFFWIDGHNMSVIEADGTDTQPFSVDMIDIAVAQRYSVLVTALNDTSSNWAIHANMDTVMFDTVPSSLNPNLTASITYDPSAPFTDLGPVPAYLAVDDIAMVPLQPLQLPPATNAIVLEDSFATMDNGINHAMFNGITYNAPLVPAALSMLTLAQNATVAAAYGPTTYVVESLDAFDITVNNDDTNKHPFHLHGHKFQLVQRSPNFTYPTVPSALSDPDAQSIGTAAGVDVANPANPMRRDTVQVPAGGSVTIRVVGNNPGAWIFHCHIEWHLEAGLAITIIEAPLLAQNFSTFPNSTYSNASPYYAAAAPALAAQCSALGLPASGNAAGFASTTDLDGLPLGPYQQKLGWLAKGIVAMGGCVLAAVVGMLSVAWYSLMGGQISEEEIEDLVRARIEMKETRRRMFGLLPPKRKK